MYRKLTSKILLEKTMIDCELILARQALLPQFKL